MQSSRRVTVKVSAAAFLRGSIEIHSVISEISAAPVTECLPAYPELVTVPDFAAR